MSRSRKGSRSERELVNLLDVNGFAVMRAPASGGATDRELPDVLAGDSDDFYAVESKSSSDEVIYIDEREIDELIYFSENFGAKPRVGVRFNITDGDPAYGNEDNPGWYFFHPDELYTTDGGNYRVKKYTAIEHGETFAELTGVETITLPE